VKCRGGRAHGTLISPDNNRILLLAQNEDPGTFRDGCQLHVWDLVQCKVVTSFWGSGPHFSPDGNYLAYFNGPALAILDVATGSIVGQPMKFYLDDYVGMPSPKQILSFSPDSTRLLVLLKDGNVRILDIAKLPTSITSSYPPHNLLIQRNHRSTFWDGWFRGETGERLIWLPDGMRHVLLAAGKECHRLILKRDDGDITVLDMDDYLKVPQARDSWRKAGVRWTDNEAEVSVAHTVPYRL
jgi:WD40 repeat protein